MSIPNILPYPSKSNEVHIHNSLSKINEAKKLAQAKMAESEEKLKVTEEAKAATEAAVIKAMGSGMLNHLQNITQTQLPKDEKQPNTEGAAPFSEVTS